MKVLLVGHACGPDRGSEPGLTWNWALSLSRHHQVHVLTHPQLRPEIEGTDLEGRPLKLSDARGKAVLLVFWGTWCGPCMAAFPKHVELLENMKGRPFVILGINSDRDPQAAHKGGADKGMTWRSWFDGPGTRGPIASNWNVHIWPTYYLLDGQGVIRQPMPAAVACSE